ncbi:hypothetical protein MLD38_027604 [Melastoma candidum]|uniref:Uncharacterized protein n=1 Tax=Melastoma candidum TaxID=119954 RepID=A0ACB9P2S5_9MYRT|nr:hypothetical protein MLD38_027604 [Melastoma candidum]
MPSGKKKRKAIRKKKELEANLADGSHDENDNLRGPDEKGGDEGDCGTPVSHVRQQTVNGGSGKPAKSDTLAVGTTTVGNKSVEVPKLKEEESSYGNGDAETLKGAVSNDDSFAGIESLKEILPKFQVNVKKLEDDESTEVSGVETTQMESAIQITDPLPQEITEVMDSTKSIALNHEDTSLVVPRDSAAIGTAQLKSTIHSAKMILDNEGTLMNVVSQASEFDSESTKVGTKVHQVSTDSSVPTPDTKNQEPESLQSLVSVNCEARDGLKLTEDTHATEYSEKQPLVAPVPRVTKRTSWMNCCGILDLFSGSSDAAVSMSNTEGFFNSKSPILP